MKKGLLLIFIILLTGCRNASDLNVEKIDALTNASTNYEYKDSMYSLNDLKEKLNPNEFGNITPSVALATVNEDNTPSIGVFIPSILTINKKDYLYAWFSSDTNTYVNLKAGKTGVFIFMEYDNTIKAQKNSTNNEKNESKLERNKGCRVLVRYVGDSEQDKLYIKGQLSESLKENKLILDIIKIYPLG